MRTVIRKRGVFWVSLVLFTLPIGRAFAPQNVSGLVVEELSSDSTAAKAGIQPGDRVISYDNKPLPSPAAFDALQENTFGKKDVVLQLVRGDGMVAVSVPLGKLGIQVRPELAPDAEKLYEEGRASSKAGNPKQSVEDWKAAARSAEQDSKGAAAWLYGRAGELLVDRREWKGAIEEYLAARELLKSEGDAAAESRTLAALGRCSQKENDFPGAAKWYELARQVDAAANYEMWVTEDLNDLGLVAHYSGDLETAQRLHKSALEIGERLAALSLEVANSLSSLGWVADDRGDLAAARDYQKRAFSIRERLAPNSPIFAASLNNLGVVSWESGDLRAARTYFGKALSIQEKLVPKSLDVAASLLNLGEVAKHEGDLAGAEDYLGRALEIRKRLAPDSLDVAAAYGDLGEVAFARGDLQLAQSHINDALAIQNRLAPNSLPVAESTANLGQIARSRGDLPAAQAYFARASAIFEQLAPGSLNLAATFSDAGGIALKEGRLPDAQSLFERGVGIIESQRGLVPSSDARALLVAEWGAAYSGLVETYVATDEIHAAFATSERARARSLLELLTEARADIRQGVEPSLLKREQQLQEALNVKAGRQTNLLSGKHTEREAAEAAKEIDAISTQYHEVEAAIRASSPRYAALTQPQPLSLEEIQRQILDKDSLLLEYSLGDGTSSLFAITQGSIKCYQLPKRSEIEALARQSYEALAARNQYIATETVQQRNARVLQADASYPKLAARLSQLILAPAVAELGTKRLLIVADGDLLQIPFGVLADPAASSPQPLLVNHEIVSLPSASVIAVQRRELSKRKPAAKQLALFADPVFEHSDERVAALASLKDAKAAETASSVATRDISFERALSEARIGDDRSKIQRLPFSREEANAIFALTQQASSLKALDFDASKSKALGDEMSQYRIVHFATHALLNNDHPELSGIVLSLVDRQGHAVDGFLRLNEVYNLNLPADLVVLSACQTGLGKQIKGEGLIGLTRGFMYAGAQRVVASLWKVDDEATSELMGRFYEKMLKEGEPAAAALRHAEIEMSQQNRWRAAYFWAGFQMAGEWK